MEAHACKIEGINSEALWKYGSKSNLLCQLVQPDFNIHLNYLHKVRKSTRRAVFYGR